MPKLYSIPAFFAVIMLALFTRALPRAMLPDAHRYNQLLDRELSYYRTPSGTEVDFIWSRGTHRIGIEVKVSRQWRPEYGRALRDLRGERVLTASHAVYVGDTPQQDGLVSVLPLYAFLEKSQTGKILPVARRPRPEARVRSARK
jgi:predicted AAA+ superfamily ATPase